jgi:hypothetical protein
VLTVLHTGYTSYGPISIGNPGVAAFRAEGPACPADGRCLISADGTLEYRVADHDGPFGPAGLASAETQVAVDVYGRVFFWAEANGGHGIFTGENPDQDVVIRTGDTLLGRTVQRVRFAEGGLNSSGQLAFAVDFTDGLKAIVRADPIPPPTTTLLVGLEVTQTIQNWVNQMPLLENKRTWVRAHLVPLDGIPRGVDLFLRGFRNGIELPESPLYAYGVSTLRPAEERSLGATFELPASWVRGGLTVRVEGAYEPLDCAEAAGPQNCEENVSFAVRSLSIRAVGFRTDSTRREPDEVYIAERMRELQTLLPVSEIFWTSTVVDWPGSSVTSKDALLAGCSTTASSRA